MQCYIKMLQKQTILFCFAIKKLSSDSFSTNVDANGSVLVRASVRVPANCFDKRNFYHASQLCDKRSGAAKKCSPFKGRNWTHLISIVSLKANFSEAEREQRTPTTFDFKDGSGGNVLAWLHRLKARHAVFRDQQRRLLGKARLKPGGLPWNFPSSTIIKKGLPCSPAFMGSGVG